MVWGGCPRTTRAASIEQDDGLYPPGASNCTYGGSRGVVKSIRYQGGQYDPPGLAAHRIHPRWVPRAGRRERCDGTNPPRCGVRSTARRVAQSLTPRRSVPTRPFRARSEVALGEARRTSTLATASNQATPLQKRAHARCELDRSAPQPAPLAARTDCLAA